MQQRGNSLQWRIERRARRARAEAVSDEEKHARGGQWEAWRATVETRQKHETIEEEWGAWKRLAVCG